MLTRLPDWEARLHAYLDSVAKTPFAWGTHDCALFVGDCVQAMTGIDPAAAYRGVYSNETGARLALKRHGKTTLVATFDDAFGMNVAPARAHRGDIVQIDDTTAGVCMGAFGFFVGDAGLVRHPYSDFTRAWSIRFE